MCTCVHVGVFFSLLVSYFFFFRRSSFFLLSVFRVLLPFLAVSFLLEKCVYVIFKYLFLNFKFQFSTFFLKVSSFSRRESVFVQIVVSCSFFFSETSRASRSGGGAVINVNGFFSHSLLCPRVFTRHAVQNYAWFIHLSLIHI